jgi:hypothetical protein
MAATMDLPAFAIGPDSRGRDYGVLSHSPGIGNALSEAGWSGDLAMVIAAWAKSEEREFAACLELPRSEGACLVLRGQRLVQQSFDRIARVNAVVLSGAALSRLGGRTELVFVQMPAPDARPDFGGADFAIDPDARLETRPYDDFGLAWRPHVLLHSADETRPEVLLRALASITPPAARLGAHTWSTTINLPARGAIDPARTAHLMIGADPPSRAGDRFIVLDTQLPGWDRAAAPQPPANYGILTRLQALPSVRSGDPVPAGTFGWSPERNSASSGELVRDILLKLWGTLSVAAMIETLARVAAFPEPEAAAAAREVAARYIEADMQQDRAPLIFAALDRAEPATRSFMLEQLGRSFDPGETSDAAMRPVWRAIAALGLDEFADGHTWRSEEVRELIADAVVGLWASVPHPDHLESAESTLLLHLLNVWPANWRAEDFGILANPDFFEWLIAQAGGMSPELVTRYSRSLLTLRVSEEAERTAGVPAVPDPLGLANQLLAMLTVLNWLEPTEAGARAAQRLSGLVRNRDR